MSNETGNLTLPLPITQCFANLSEGEKNEYFMKERTLKLDRVNKVYFGWLPMPVAVAALSVTILYIVTVLHAIRRRRVSRKCYLLLLNKAIGDALCALSAIVAVFYVLLSSSTNKNVMAILETFFIGCFWSATVSFVSLSIIKLYAVWQPLNYRQTFTMPRCKKLVLLSWIIFALMAFCTLFVHALVKIPSLSRWSGCRLETCLSLMYKVRNSFVIAMYAITIISYVITVLLVQRVHRSGSSFHGKYVRKDSRRKTRFPMWKLSLNVATFAFLNLSYVLWSINIVVQQNHCSFLLNLAEMMQLLGIIRFTLLLRVLLDPIISFLIDTQLRRQILYWSGLRSRSLNISPRASQKTVSSAASFYSNIISCRNVMQRNTIATIC